ncbi:hypothetical protein [Rhodoferax ferrireducens]|uniref:hypothetical protein n=1 Tax=Rhodoferax ferrireducens TaxID=192843 RepID=UPI000E0CF922|nr:hypothetical protein [Rhodoferax ferrireducens]
MFTTLLDVTAQARLHDLAKAEAQRLRGEAMQHVGGEAVDDFWRGADAVWQRSLQTGQAVSERSAARLKARLARHGRERSTSTSAHKPTTPSGA